MRILVKYFGALLAIGWLGIAVAGTLDSSPPTIAAESWALLFLMWISCSLLLSVALLLRGAAKGEVYPPQPKIWSTLATANCFNTVFIWALVGKSAMRAPSKVPLVELTMNYLLGFSTLLEGIAMFVVFICVIQVGLSRSGKNLF